MVFETNSSELFSDVLTATGFPSSVEQITGIMSSPIDLNFGLILAVIVGWLILFFLFDTKYGIKKSKQIKRDIDLTTTRSFVMASWITGFFVLVSAHILSWGVINTLSMFEIFFNIYPELVMAIFQLKELSFFEEHIPLLAMYAILLTFLLTLFAFKNKTLRKDKLPVLLEVSLMFVFSLMTVTYIRVILYWTIMYVSSSGIEPFYLIIYFLSIITLSILLIRNVKQQVNINLLGASIWLLIRSCGFMALFFSISLIFIMFPLILLTLQIHPLIPLVVIILSVIFCFGVIMSLKFAVYDFKSFKQFQKDFKEIPDYFRL